MYFGNAGLDKAHLFSALLFTAELVRFLYAKVPWKFPEIFLSNQDKLFKVTPSNASQMLCQKILMYGG